jgi:hypothetical protein
MRNLLLVFLFVCLYAGTVLAAEYWTQPSINQDEQILFAAINAKRLEMGLPALQLDGQLLNAARSGRGTVLVAQSFDQVMEEAQAVVLVKDVSRVGLSVSQQAQAGVTVVVATK